ncbi:IQ motif and ankyrin repeat domain-containing protein 1-like [Chiloscyllium plagiosum]|uniref:IQ motif and ankyrin repeat domain-containing protein 1-like n=1 Tax=Chiloscyllium plagiosum TaxID=36176 RepID=UPI001CB86FF0|nr:IQ motif and ankyrin repeat domain-containing protein 1-like [Chiloscyllium plagiosum]
MRVEMLAFVALVKREQEAAAREREKEEKERKQKQEEQKRRTRMLEAAFDGDVDEMKALLKEVSDLDFKNGIRNDEMGKVIQRRHQLALADCTDAHGNTPLSEASGGGHPEAIRFLIEKGANPNSKGAYGRTPLYRAAFGGHLAALEMLLQFGGDPRIYAEDGITPEEIASTDAAIKILHEWDISTTVALGEKIESERQRILAAEKKLKLEETNRIQNQISEITKELAQYQYELHKAYCELNKRINEHDKCVSKNMSKTDITLQAIHGAEELLAEKRAAVSRTEDKLSLAKLELREKLQREASLTKPIGALCHIRELDDVLLKDVGNKIKQDGRWPLIIDPSGQASIFLRYRDTNFYDALNPGHMQPQVLRLGLLGAIRYGKMLVIDMMEVNMFEAVSRIFNQIEAGLMEKLLNKELLQKDSVATRHNLSPTSSLWRRRDRPGGVQQLVFANDKASCRACLKSSGLQQVGTLHGYIIHAVYQEHHRAYLQLAKSIGNHTEQQRAWALIGRSYLFRHEKDQSGEALQEAQKAFIKSLEILDHKLQAPIRSAPSKEPNTSTSKKSNKPDSGNFAADQSTLSPVNDLQGRGDKPSEMISVDSRYFTSVTPPQPLMYAIKEAKSENLDVPLTFTSGREVYRGPTNQEIPSMSSGKNEQSIANRNLNWGGKNVMPQNNQIRLEQEYQPDIASQVREAIAAGLAQADTSFQKKMDVLQQMVETNNKKTEQAVGQVCNSVNRVKVNLEIVDSTLETINSRLLEFQQSIKTGLKDLTKEVGNLAFSLTQKSTDNQKNLVELCADNPTSRNLHSPGPRWHNSEGFDKY